MAQSGYTPILIYGSGTASATPSSGNLTSSANGAELALNYNDGKLYYKDNAGVVQLLASKAGASGSVTSVAMTVPAFLSVAGSPITTSGTLAVTLSGTALPIANGGTGSTSTAYCSLTTNVSGTLPIANGGTNSTATATAGGIGYGTGTAHAYTAAGTAGYLLQSNGSSAPTWVAAPSTSPGGSTTQVQYNNAGAFAGSANFTYASGTLSILATTSSAYYATADNGYALFDGATNSSGARININAGTSGAGTTILGYNATRTGYTPLNYSASEHYWKIGTTERMRIDSGGVVGIANSSPQSSATRLAVAQPATPSGTLPTYFFNAGWDNQGAQDNIGMLLQFNAGGTPNGSVLQAKLGSTSSFNLNVVGTLQNSGGAGGRPPVYYYSGPTYNSYGQPNTSSLSAAGTPQVAIFTEMTGMYDGAPISGLSVKIAGAYGGNSTRDAYGCAVQLTTAFGSDKGYGTSYGYYANVSSNITANYAFYAAAGDAAKPGGGSWTSTSDARVKTVIGQYSRGLDDILKINVIDFEYNGKGGHPVDGRRYTGVIAQEMQEIFPEMVKVHRAKLEETDTEDTEILMVDNSALVYALVNAVKELKAEIQALKGA